MKVYNVRISVGFSELLEIEANNELEAKKIATDMFYNGDIMGSLTDLEYYDGLIGVDVEEEL